MTITHSYEGITDGRWMPGVLHLHNHGHDDSTRTYAPCMQDSLMKYRDHGIQFLMYTEFHRYQPNPANTFAQLLEDAGSAPAPNPGYRDMLLIPGMEIYDGHGTGLPNYQEPHFVCGGFERPQDIAADGGLEDLSRGLDKVMTPAAKVKQ